MVADEIKRLANAYVPEWSFTEENPDIGSVIALIYAEQMDKTELKYDRMPRKLQGELVGLTGVSPLPARPARAILVAEIDPQAKNGIRIPEGSRFFAEALDGGQVVYKSTHDILASSASLKVVLAVSGKKQKVTAWEEPSFREALPLFDYSGPNCYQDEIRLEHPMLPDGQLTFQRSLPVSGEAVISNLRVTASGYGMRPDFLYDGSREIPRDKAKIFGDEIAEYKECYIGQDEVFSKKSAKIRMEFDLEMLTHDLRQIDEPEVLKPVMRRIKKGKARQAVSVNVDEIDISYYNGFGFKKLSCNKGFESLFQRQDGEHSLFLEFLCPDDMEPLEVGGYLARCIRLSVVRSDNCYLADGVHYCPVLCQIRFSYSYGKNGRRPLALIRKRGGRTENLLQKIEKDYYARLSFAFPYEGESMLFGFDKVLPKGPASLYMILHKYVHVQGMELRYEYSVQGGFRPLKVTDHTGGFSARGLLLFQVPQDAAMLELEGRECFWIRVRDAGGNSNQEYRPKLQGLYVNGMEVLNIEEKNIREYYIEQPRPFMEFPVQGDNILDAEVWVNELGQITGDEMVRMMTETPCRVQPEYDLMGRISEFYVKWEEAAGGRWEYLNKRSYILDRKEKRLRFGDGKQSNIPQNTRGTAFKAQIRCCRGHDGNTSPGAVNKPAISAIFLRRVWNPCAAQGGSDMETEELLLHRGQCLLRTGKRLVSAQDYVQEAEGYSERIAQAVYIPCGEGYVDLVLLMRDFEEGPESFYGIRDGLKQHLNKLGELTVRPEKIKLSQPLFVKVSMDVYLGPGSADFLKVQEQLTQHITSFLDPVKAERQKVQKIGHPLKTGQIEMMLHSVGIDTDIRFFDVTVQYTDGTGQHTKELGSMEHLPNVVYINGEHRIYEI